MPAAHGVFCAHQAACRHINDRVGLVDTNQVSWSEHLVAAEVLALNRGLDPLGGARVEVQAFSVPVLSETLELEECRAGATQGQPLRFENLADLVRLHDIVI